MTEATSNKLMIAGLLGFAAGILYAPRKGTETQAKLKLKMEEAKSNIRRKTDSAKSKVEDLKEDANQATDKLSSKADDLSRDLPV